MRSRVRLGILGICQDVSLTSQKCEISCYNLHFRQCPAVSNGPERTRVPQRPPTSQPISWYPGPACLPAARARTVSSAPPSSSSSTTSAWPPAFGGSSSPSPGFSPQVPYILIVLFSGLRIRIRIGSGFNRVSGSGFVSRRAKKSHESRKNF